ncbi:cysteine hydrolase family protein [Methylobacterium planeticum]|nr:isochorismatase family protein [Methylobacterium planeticum]
MFSEKADRHTSSWIGTGLGAGLQARGNDTLVVTGGETDLCGLSAVLGAVDCGYRAAVVADALCISSDLAHQALLTLHRSRYGRQVETVTTGTVLENWTR